MESEINFKNSAAIVRQGLLIGLLAACLLLLLLAAQITRQTTEQQQQMLLVFMAAARLCGRAALTGAASVLALWGILGLRRYQLDVAGIKIWAAAFLLPVTSLVLQQQCPHLLAEAIWPISEFWPEIVQALFVLIAAGRQGEPWSLRRVGLPRPDLMGLLFILPGYGIFLISRCWLAVLPVGLTEAHLWQIPSGLHAAYLLGFVLLWNGNRIDGGNLFRHVTTVVFTDQPQEAENEGALVNPAPDRLMRPLPNLTRIIIANPGHDAYRLEQFVTYAADSIGQAYLRRTVDVHLYGDPDRLGRNLWNALKTLCRAVHVHPQSTYNNQDQERQNLSLPGQY